MKRFILFAFEHYYPAGGLNDARGSYDTVEEATKVFDKGDEDGYTWDGGHIFDTKTGKRIDL